MKNPHFKMIISFFCIYLTGFISQNHQFISAFILILSFGILHGANDLLLLHKIYSKKALSSFNILIYYLLVVLGIVCTFYFVPLLALFFFVVISAFHFGEQHWIEKLEQPSGIIEKFFLFFYGFFILFLLFYLHNIEVLAIVKQITAVKIPAAFITYSLIISTVIIFLLGIAMSFKIKKFQNMLLLEFFYLIMFAIIFKTTSLLWGFAIYFVFWHSFPSIINQVEFLFGDWSAKNFLLYCKKAFWFWAISLFGIALLYFVFESAQLFEAMFFAFLAAITVPHVLVVLYMFRKINKAV